REEVLSCSSWNSPPSLLPRRKETRTIKGTRVHEGNPNPSSRALALSPHSPKRTQAEPCERQGKTHRKHNSARGGVASRIFRILTGESDSPDASHRQKNSADDFKP